MDKEKEKLLTNQLIKNDDGNTNVNCNTNVNTNNNSLKLKGKTISLISKITGIIFILTIYIVYLIVNKQLPSSDEVIGILLIGIGITNIISLPIDLSIIIKNLKGN